MVPRKSPKKKISDVTRPYGERSCHIRESFAYVLNSSVQADEQAQRDFSSQDSI